MANLKPGAVSKYCVNKNKRVTFRQLIHYTPKAQKVIFSIITSNIKNLISKNPGLAKSLTNTEIPDSVTTKLTCTWLYYANLWNENTFISAGLWKYVSAWTNRVVKYTCYPELLVACLKEKQKLFTKKVRVWLGSKYDPARFCCWSWIWPC